MKMYILTLLILTLSLQKVTSLDCFKCDYTNYMDCHNKISCRETSRERVACYKFVVKDGLGNMKYTKDCGKYVEDPRETCAYFEEQARNKQENIIGCFNCEYDGCNSTGKLQSTFWLLASLLLYFL